MAEQDDINQFFATGNASSATPAPLDPFPKLADEFKANVPFKAAIENWDKKVADWIKRSQQALRA